MDGQRSTSSAALGLGLGSELAQLASVAALAIPALGIVVVDPLMSLVDTACIGRTSSIQLAALAPNSAVFNMIFQVFTFIGVSVTNVLACNSPLAPGISDLEARRRVSLSQRLQSYALLASAFCGVVCAATCWLAGSRLLTVMGASAELLPEALPYLRIRGSAAPAVLIMNACQGAFLGQQNTVTPLGIFAVAAASNAVLGATAVLVLGWGLAGAATATAVVQYLTAGAFLWALHAHGASGRGVRLVWAGLPGPADLAPFVDVGWKLLTRTLFKMAAFASISSVATTLPQTAVASHQIALQLFWLLSFFPEPLSMAAQSLIARDTTDRPQVIKTAWLLVRMAGFLAVVLAGLVAMSFLFGAYMFTPDQDIVDSVHDLVLPGIVGIVVCTYVMQCDGIYIGSLDFAHLPRTNLVACFVCVGLLHFGVRNDFGLVWIWWCMVAFFASRLLQHVLHALLHFQTCAFGHYMPSVERDSASSQASCGAVQAKLDGCDV